MADRSTLEQCLGDINFPAGKDEIAECASGNSCPLEVLSQLRDMQVSSYRSKDDVLCHLGDISACS
jgi:hypothetical protein